MGRQQGSQNHYWGSAANRIYAPAGASPLRRLLSSISVTSDIISLLNEYLFTLELETRGRIGGLGHGRGPGVWCVAGSVPNGRCQLDRMLATNINFLLRLMEEKDQETFIFLLPYMFLCTVSSPSTYTSYSSVKVSAITEIFESCLCSPFFHWDTFSM